MYAAALVLSSFKNSESFQVEKGSIFYTTSSTFNFCQVICASRASKLPVYNSLSVYVTDHLFVNIVHYQYVAFFLISLLELKLGLYSVYLS